MRVWSITYKINFGIFLHNPDMEYIVLKNKKEYFRQKLDDTQKLLYFPNWRW